MRYTNAEEQCLCPKLHMELCTQLEACYHKLLLRQLGAITVS